MFGWFIYEQKKTSESRKIIQFFMKEKFQVVSKKLVLSRDFFLSY